MGLADDRKQVNLMTVHVSKSVTVHEVSNTKYKILALNDIEIKDSISFLFCIYGTIVVRWRC